MSIWIVLVGLGLLGLLVAVFGWLLVHGAALEQQRWDAERATQMRAQSPTVERAPGSHPRRVG